MEAYNTKPKLVMQFERHNYINDYNEQWHSQERKKKQTRKEEKQTWTWMNKNRYLPTLKYIETSIWAKCTNDFTVGKIVHAYRLFVILLMLYTLTYLSHPIIIYNE